MLFREYDEKDAEEIVKWIKTERELRFWSWTRYKDFPIKKEDINNNYSECVKNEKFYPFTLEDDNKNIVGHITIRVPEGKEKVARIGFVILNRDYRGKGYGKYIVKEAIKFAKEKLQATEIGLAVFTNNESAYNCYLRAGFKDSKLEKGIYKFNDEEWDLMEMILE